MIIKSQNPVPLVASDKEVEYPLLPLMTGVLFPGNMLTILVGRPENLALLKRSHADQTPFVASYSHAEVDTPGPSPVHQIGVFAVVRDIREGAGGSQVVTLEGLRRASVTRVTTTEPYLQVIAHDIEGMPFVKKTIADRTAEVIAIVREITQLDPIYSPETWNVLKLHADDPAYLADHVAATFHFSLAAKQELLETIALDERFRRLIYHLNGELSRAATILSIHEKVKKQIEEDQHKYFLRQQLHEIRKQLGEDFSEEKEAARWKNVLKSMPQLPHEVIDRARIEIDRLTQLSVASAEYGATKSYLDWLLNLPWGKTIPESYEISDVEKILSTDYYGPVTLKEQILQRLSVRKLLGGRDSGPTLCLVGVPGTGKASLAKAIAKALGKEFIRISVGGMNEVADLKGRPRTYLGAYPGKIIRSLRDADTTDPVLLLEDIDYFNVENDSSVNMALLEAIDSRYNSKFLDHYIGVPYDLSKVFFVCSVRSYEEIPEQFIPRMEIIELPGYIEREKVTIGKRYIIPNMLKKHGLLKSEVRVADKTLSKIISNYTQEAGLLGFSQQIEKIFRKLALQKAEQKKRSWTISEKNLESYLGTPLFIPEKAETDPEIGIAAGLAWTGAGGELMF
ncbi:AAA family ATPase, partial [candidate division GN15 bacterium]|nr:AAA family ATPase [candidate division GN15 bacterium]